MNCDCLEKAAQKIMDLGKYEQREIINVELPDMIWTLGTNAGKDGKLSYEEFEVDLEGLKKPKKIKVAHTFCPFCGIKAGKIDENTSDNNPLEL